MTEFELIMAYQGAEASWQGTLAVFTSIVFGYLAVAYFVGASLTRLQVAIITLLYTLFSLLMIGALLDIMRRFIEFAVEIKEFSPERSFVGTDSEVPQYALWFWMTSFLCAYAAGLVFMLQIRRNSDKRRDPE